MKIIKRKPKQKGFTLIELLLIVGFISIASIGIYSTAKLAVNTRSAAVEATHLKALGDVLVNSYGIAGDYSLVTTNTVAQNPSMLPNGMVDSNSGNLVNEFGGTIQVQPAPDLINMAGTPLHGFTIIDQNIDAKACIKVVTNAEGMFTQIQVNNQVVQPVFGQVNPDALAVYCSQNDMASISFTYYGF
ncbi:MAG TPA: type 4 pilus major pilin [Anaerovoracaceae bacterium]|nr:type 4 pilus major pilin [Anaerovoracaceae bacterium]